MGMLIYTLTITLVKCQVLLHRRIIFSTTAYKRKTLVIGIAYLACFILTVVIDLCLCHPFNAVFNAQPVFSDQCIDLQSFYWATTDANVAFYFVTLLLPLHGVGDDNVDKIRTISEAFFLLGSLYVHSKRGIFT